MIVSPSINNYKEQTERIKQNADSTLTRSAIILANEIENAKPVAILGLPAVGLITFFGKNQAFLPNPNDKALVKFLKNCGNKITDITSKSLKSIGNTVFKGVKKTAKFFKDEIGSCFKELSKFVKTKSKIIFKSISDNTKDFVKSTLKF